MELRTEPREILAFLLAGVWLAALVLLDWSLQTQSFLRDGLSGVLVGALFLITPRALRERLDLRPVWPPLLMAFCIFAGLAVGTVALKIARSLPPPPVHPPRHGPPR